MKEQKIIVSVWQADSLAELLPDEAQLVEEAYKATRYSYAPYSNFNVGSVVLLENGVIIQGSNQENSAYPSGLCAERVAVFYANSQYPDVAIKAVAITSAINGQQNEQPVFPCGACRQSLLQSELRQAKSIRVIMAGSKKISIVDSVKSLLPLSFDLEGFK